MSWLRTAVHECGVEEARSSKWSEGTSLLEHPETPWSAFGRNKEKIRSRVERVKMVDFETDVEVTGDPFVRTEGQDEGQV